MNVIHLSLVYWHPTKRSFLFRHFVLYLFCFSKALCFLKGRSFFRLILCFNLMVSWNHYGLPSWPASKPLTLLRFAVHAYSRIHCLWKRFAYKCVWKIALNRLRSIWQHYNTTFILFYFDSHSIMFEADKLRYLVTKCGYVCQLAWKIVIYCYNLFYFMLRYIVWLLYKEHLMFRHVFHISTSYFWYIVSDPTLLWEHWCFQKDYIISFWFYNLNYLSIHSYTRTSLWPWSKLISW